MRRVKDRAKYEHLQHALALALVQGIRDGLERAGLAGPALEDATGSIAFSVAAVYDGSAYVDAGDDHLVPILGFALGRMRDRLLIPDEGGGDLHTFVAGAVRQLFEVSSAPAP